MGTMNPMQDLLTTVERLRAPGGCPWDREQTHESLVRCLQEETAELVETIDERDYPHMREELGDVLLQVVMHAEIAREKGAFDFNAVAAEINEKLIRRHPHVFGNVKAETSDQVLVNWAAIKEDEKKGKPQSAPKGTLKRPPATLATLLQADELVKQLAKKNFTPEGLDPAKVEMISADLTEKDAGRKLLEIVAACRRAKIDPESALRKELRSIADSYDKDSSPVS
jgi:XTP/dITP diphosphohydrolase/tetrapyrrole methylase family protein/MazG family protein